MFRFLVVLTLSLHVVSLAVADRGVIEGSVVCVRSGVPVSTHPVMLMQGRDTIARALTDRMGRFKLEFNYVPGTPLKIKAGASPTYLESPLAEVQADTEVTIGVMPQWATILGIVTDRETGRGLADIPVRAGRGKELIQEAWATVTTDATGVYMMKVRAFDNGDVSKPVTDLWLAVNEGDGADHSRAVVHTESVPLWPWPDPTQPTKVEVCLPASNATGLTLADVVSVTPPDAMVVAQTPRAVAAPGPVASSGQGAAAAAPAGAGTVAGPIECTIICPHCGKPIRLILQVAP